MTEVFRRLLNHNKNKDYDTGIRKLFFTETKFTETKIKRKI